MHGVTGNATIAPSMDVITLSRVEVIGHRGRSRMAEPHSLAHSRRLDQEARTPGRVDAALTRHTFFAIQSGVAV
jgi:hypothetical protein